MAALANRVKPVENLPKNPTTRPFLWLIVDETGPAQIIRVVRGLGNGLDAKALEAVQQWRFQPARKDGKPVNVRISVEVGFHLS